MKKIRLFNKKKLAMLPVLTLLTCAILFTPVFASANDVQTKLNISEEDMKILKDLVKSVIKDMLSGKVDLFDLPEKPEPSKPSDKPEPFGKPEPSEKPGPSDEPDRELPHNVKDGIDVVSMFAAPKAQPIDIPSAPDSEETEIKADTLWIYYSDNTFDQYAQGPDGYGLFSTGTYSLKNGANFNIEEDQDNGSIVINRNKKKTFDESGQTGLKDYDSSNEYKLGSLGFTQIFGPKDEGKKIEAVFGDDNQLLYTDKSGVVSHLDSVWIMFDDMTFKQFVFLDDDIKLYGSGYYELSDGADFNRIGLEEDSGTITLEYDYNMLYKVTGQKDSGPRTYDLKSLGLTCYFEKKTEETSELNAFPQLVTDDYDMSRYEGDEKYFECHGNTWKLTDDSAKQYPNLKAPLKEIADNEKKSFKETLDENDKDAREFLEENRAYGDDEGFACYSDTGISCADPKRVSLVSTEFSFLGGAHPYTDTKTYNIDAVTGQFIPLSAVISDKDGLVKILKEALEDQYKDHDFFGLDDSLESFDLKDYIFAFNPNGLTFYFDPAVLSPYADSGEQIDLTYEDLSSVLDKRFEE